MFGVTRKIKINPHNYRYVSDGDVERYQGVDFHGNIRELVDSLCRDDVDMP